MFNAISFDLTAYDNAMRLAGNAFRNADKNGSKWASMSLAALLLDKLTLHAVAIKLYQEMQPKTAKGKDAKPKEVDNGTISVSSLRSANGGDAALKAFNNLQFVYTNRDILPNQIAAFAISGGSLAGLVNAIKAEKAKIAQAEAEAITPETEAEDKPEREGDEDTPPATDGETMLDIILAFNAKLNAAMELSDAEQLALVQTVRLIGAMSQGSVEMKEAA